MTAVLPGRSTAQAPARLAVDSAELAWTESDGAAWPGINRDWLDLMVPGSDTITVRELLDQVAIGLVTGHLVQAWSTAGYLPYIVSTDQLLRVPDHDDEPAAELREHIHDLATGEIDDEDVIKLAGLASDYRLHHPIEAEHDTYF